MRIIGALCAAAALAHPGQALAMRPPKYERAAEIAAALRHLSEAASLLGDPIDAIVYAGGEVRFTAGRCFVPARVHATAVDTGGRAAPGGIRYDATLGAAKCP